MARDHGRSGSLARRADHGQLATRPVHRGRAAATTTGNRLQRTIYHYWFHNGENQAIRQQLGHARLGQFVGNIDDEAPYRPEPPG